MRRWSKSAGTAAGILFLAVSSVYAGEATPATQAVAEVGAVNPAATTEPTATGAVTGEAKPSAAEAKPSAAEAKPSAPAGEGQSLTKSQVNVSDSGTVEIHVNDANIVEVLRMLSLQSQRNIISSKEVRGTLTANLYDVTIPEALDAILHANGYAYREKGNFIYVYTAKELVEIDKAERVMRTEIFRLSYSPAANVVTMIKPVLSPDAQVSFTTPAVTGIGQSATDAGGNAHSTEDMVVVTDYPDKLDQAKKLIEEIDKRPQQVLVEATILSATLNEDNQMGVDFNVLGGVNFNTLLTNSGGQVIGGQIGSSGGTTAGGSGATSGGGSVTTGAVNTSPTLGSLGTGNTFTGSQPNGFKIGILGNNMSVFLSALEGVSNTTVLANPKILALNKQRGEVEIGSSDGYHTTTVTETSTVQSVQLFDTGTHLIFRPYIGTDGYIRMEIHPEDSTGGVVGDLPHKTTTELTTNIMVKDGHTIVIGGLFREASSVSKSQVPGLGNIPGLGYLFRNQADHTAREEIIILLTPHIIKDDSSYSKESLEALKDGDQLRIGVRHGMMFFGRERLAESCYDSAVAEMAKPNPDRAKALWHLNSAINLNPQFLEAIKMKEEITGQELRSVDNSTIHGFVTRRIVAERDLAVHSPPAAVEITPPPPRENREPATRPVSAVLRPVARKAPEQHTESVVELPTSDSASDNSPTSQPAVTELSTGEIAPK
jgi:type IV pilus assembly protein PilQ